MPLPTWDVFIGLAFVIGIAYGFILRREKTITFLCSTYIGLVIASSFAQYVFDLLNGNTILANQVWIHSNASISTVSIVLLLLSSFFISGAINSTAKSGGDLSLFEIIIYSALNMALIISSIIGFLAPEKRDVILAASKVGSFLYATRGLWVIIPPIALIILNFRKK